MERNHPLSSLNGGGRGGSAEEHRGRRQQRQRMTSKTPAAAAAVVVPSFCCPVCEKTFASEKYVRMHLGIHRMTEPEVLQEETGDCPSAGGNSTGVWECSVCGKLFLQASYYRNHVRTHSEERPFVCDLCSVAFKERYHLKKHHLFKHTDEMNEQCRKCGKRFKDSTAVRAHERIHSDARPFACRRCGKAFKTSECLWHHDHRSKVCTATVQPAEKGDRTVCTSQAERRRSAGVVHAENGVMGDLSQLLTVSPSRLTSKLNFGCESQKQMIERDGIRFSSSSLASSTSNESYERLMLTNEGGKSEDLEEEMPEWGFSASSSTSDYSVYDETNKTSRMTALHSNGSSCVIANRWLEKSSSKERRIRQVIGRIVCTRCGRHFASSRAFERHVRLHSELRPHRCTVCDVGFKLKVHLKKHNLYRHNADYPCKCSVCGKGFKDTSAVRLHERIHSSERPFLCPCGKAFKTRENLWGHRHRLKHDVDMADQQLLGRSPSDGTEDASHVIRTLQGDTYKNLPHKASQSPSGVTQSNPQSHRVSFSGKDEPACIHQGLDFLEDLVKAEATGDSSSCASRIENSSNRTTVDCHGRGSRYWTHDEVEEMKILPKQMMTADAEETTLNGHDEHLFVTPADLQMVDDDQRCWSHGIRHNIAGNSLPSFETLFSALRSCVGNWQEAGTLSPLSHNGCSAELTHDPKSVGTKAAREPAACAETPEVLVETTRGKGVCGRRALFQRFMQSQELCAYTEQLTMGFHIETATL